MVINGPLEQSRIDRDPWQETFTFIPAMSQWDFTALQLIAIEIKRDLSHLFSLPPQYMPQSRRLFIEGTKGCQVVQLGDHGTGQGRTQRYVLVGSCLVVYLRVCPCPKDTSSARKRLITRWPHHIMKVLVLLEPCPAHSSPHVDCGLEIQAVKKVFT
jgi:hypothetical protein